MALQKDIQTQYGVTANYLRVAGTNFNWAEKQAHIDVVVYINQQARLENKQPIGNFSVDFKESDFDFTENKVIEQSYLKIKTLPEFSDATDV
jgi:DUF971 family protein